MRVLIEYNYLHDNIDESLISTINGYYVLGYEVLVWYKYNWLNKYVKPTSEQLTEMLDFINDNDISTTGFLLNFDENFYESNLLLTSDIFIPER